jgi:hypothetical protein
MLSSGMKCYHLGQNVIIWDEMLSSGAKVIIWGEMLSFGVNYFIWGEMLSFGIKCYHLGCNVIIWSYCYHLVLSCDVIIWDDNTPLFIFPGNFTHSSKRPYHHVFSCPWNWLSLRAYSFVS